MMKLDTLNKTNNMKEWVQNISTPEYFRMYDKICLTLFDQNNFHTFKTLDILTISSLFILETY